MYLKALVGTLLLGTVCAFGQQQNVRAAYALQRMSTTGGLSETVYGIPSAAPRLLGDVYMDTAFHQGSFILTDKEKPAGSVMMRYNIRDNQLELQYGFGINVISGEKVKSFSYAIGNFDRYFVNAHHLEFEDESTDGFLEILIDADIMLVRHTAIGIKRTTYNPALDNGFRDDKILKKKRFYFSAGNELRRVPGNKKELSNQFQGKESKIIAFIKEKGLRIKKEDDLVTLFNYINQVAPD